MSFATSIIGQLLSIFSASSPDPPETSVPREPPPAKIQHVPLDASRRMPVLPLEVIVDIVIYTGAPLLPPSHAPYDQYFGDRKAHWNALDGIASSTKYFRLLLVKRWFYVLIARDPYDWTRFADSNWMSGIQQYAQIVLSAGGALTSSPRLRTNPLTLIPFNRLYAVSIDCHNDFLRTSGYPYYALVQALPASVERLEILNAHGPDEHIIKLVSQYCPKLTELRLGRCTMFSNQDCVWWKAHPGDHDAYMADRGIEAYAGAVASLFENVPRLCKLHIGVYLTPIEAVWAHRVDHRKLHPIHDAMRHANPEGVHNHLHQVALATAMGEDPEPPINYNYPPLAKKEIWDAPCAECIKRFKVPAEQAEMRAAAVLAARVWSLRSVSFASFTSPGRVGPSSWEVRPRHSVTKDELTVEDFDAMVPSLREENSPTRHVVVDVGRLNANNEFTAKASYIFGISIVSDRIVVSPPINAPRMFTIF